MDYSNFEKIISIENSHACYIENDEFVENDPLKEVNEHLSNGWVLITIDAIPNDDHTSHVREYILGFPKSNPT